MTLNRLFDLEPALDPAGDPAGPADPAAGAPDPGLTGEPAATEPVVEPAEPALSPEQIAAFQSNPEIREWIAQEAAEIADQRYAQLAQTGQQAQQQTPGGDSVDLNEMLDPYGDNFGVNLVQTISQIVGQAMAPMQQGEQARQQTAAETELNQTIADQAQAAGLPEQANPVVRSLAETHYARLAPRFGEQRGSDMALAQAIREVQALTGTAAASGGQARLDALHAVAQAAGAPAANGATALNVPPPAASPREVFNRHFSLAPNNT